MTDIWCFTCDHELRHEILAGRYVHLHEDEADGCICTEDGEECAPL